MPSPQITNPLGAYGLPGPGTGGQFGGVTIEAQTRSTALNSNSAGSTDGNFRTILAGMVVTPSLASSSYYGQGTWVVQATTGLAQVAGGIALENISAYWGSTGSTGAVKVQSPQDQQGSVMTYGVAYAMFASTQHPGAGDKAVPAYVTIATTSDSLFAATCHFGLCALSTLGISASVFPTTSAGPSNIVGIAYTSLGGISVTAATSGPQLYPIMVRPGG